MRPAGTSTDVAAQVGYVDPVNKEHELVRLAQLRREAQWPGYSGIADYHDGIYDCDFVSPYTKSAKNWDADVMVLLQDWASHDALAGPVHPQRVALGHDPTRQTNKRLKSLLVQRLGLDLADVYATNVFPFVKPHDMGSSLPQRDLDRAAREFALPQIQTVRPLLAICLGIATFNAVAGAAGRKKLPTLADAVESSFVYGPTEVWCQAHTGQRGFNARNKVGVDRVSDDWASMADSLQRRRAARR